MGTEAKKDDVEKLLEGHWRQKSKSHSLRHWARQSTSKSQFNQRKTLSEEERKYGVSMALNA
jgi:hypothetical protein